MKKSFFLLVIILTISSSLISQEIKSDTRPQLEKEDTNNRFNSGELTNLDLVKALGVLGVGIHKFDLGECEEEYKFIILVEEFKNGKITWQDTLLNDRNLYHYFTKGTSDYYFDYCEKLNIFTKQDQDELHLHFDLYDRSFKRIIPYSITEKGQFYNIREYQESKWQVNKKVPLLVFASSWYDERIDMQRFCGRLFLNEGEPGTVELLSSSPHYYVISYFFIK